MTAFGAKAPLDSQQLSAGSPSPRLFSVTARMVPRTVKLRDGYAKLIVGFREKTDG